MNFDVTIPTGKNAGRTYRERFWSLVGPPTCSGCREWLGPLFGNGYGRFPRGAQGLLAHRVAYYLTHGILTPGLVVMHHCDNRRCCSPARLSLATQKENMQDAVKKNRLHPAKGEKAGLTLLDRVRVAEIRRLASEGFRYRHIAGWFRVSPKQVSVVARGVQWSHLPQEKQPLRRRPRRGGVTWSA